MRITLRHILLVLLLVVFLLLPSPFTLQSLNAEDRERERAREADEVAKSRALKSTKQALAVCEGSLSEAEIKLSQAAVVSKREAEVQSVGDTLDRAADAASSGQAAADGRAATTGSGKGSDPLVPLSECAAALAEAGNSGAPGAPGDDQALRGFSLESTLGLRSCQRERRALQDRADLLEARYERLHAEAASTADTATQMSGSLNASLTECRSSMSACARRVAELLNEADTAADDEKRAVLDCRSQLTSLTAQLGEQEQLARACESRSAAATTTTTTATMTAAASVPAAAAVTGARPLVRRAAPVRPLRRGVTLVTHMDESRISGNLKAMAARWAGPMAVAVVADTPEQVAKIGQRFFGVQAAGRRDNIAYSVLMSVDKDESEIRYPVNTLRNRALSAAHTELVYMVDGDFIPSEGLYGWIMDNYDEILRASNQPDRPAAYVVPIFMQTNRFDDRPATQADMLAALQAGKAGRPGDPADRPHHGLVDYDRWATAVDPYRIDFRFFFEPYLVVSLRQVPEWDQRFAYYGFDKCMHAYTMDRMGFEFFVIPEHFTVHLPHPQESWSTALNGTAPADSPTVLRLVDQVLDEFGDTVTPRLSTHLATTTTTTTAATGAVDSGVVEHSLGLDMLGSDDDGQVMDDDADDVVDVVSDAYPLSDEEEEGVDAGPVHRAAAGVVVVDDDSLSIIEPLDEFSSVDDVSVDDAYMQ
jgi:glycosyltransferase-like protein LARGE